MMRLIFLLYEVKKNHTPPITEVQKTKIIETKKDIASAINIPVSCGGVTVMPGDVVVADITGVTVFSKEDAPSILEKAKAIFDEELKIVEDVRKGKLTIDIYGFPSFDE